MDVDTLSRRFKDSKRLRIEGQQEIEDFYESKELPEH